MRSSSWVCWDQAALPITLLPFAALIPPGSQESAADPGEETGQLHPLGSCQHPGGFIPQVPLPALGTPCQRPHDGKPHQHLLGECFPLHRWGPICSSHIPSLPIAQSLGVSQSRSRLGSRGEGGTAGLGSHSSWCRSPRSRLWPGSFLRAGCSGAPRGALAALSPAPPAAV